MTVLGTIRNVFAYFVVAAYLPSLFLWLAIHPFASFWRRFGIVATYLVLGVPVVAYLVLAWFVRGALLGADLGTNPVTITLGVAGMATSFWMSHHRRKQLSFAVLSGTPELSRDRYPGRLLTEGVYARIRHPRYVEAYLWTVGYALFANYVGPYVVVGVALPVTYLVVLVEERELRKRFGAAYDAYCRRVPRFIPRFRGAGRSGTGPA